MMQDQQARDRVEAACIRSWSAYVGAWAAHGKIADPRNGAGHERDWDAYNEAMDELERANRFMTGP